MVRDSRHADQAAIEDELKTTGRSSRIDINKRLFYEVVYRDGSECKVTQKPRSTRIHFYCDQYRVDKDLAMAVIDISEPDYCEYLFKVSTRFMCAAGTQFNKASSKLHSSTTAEVQRPALSLDAAAHTVQKQITCSVKTDF